MRSVSQLPEEMGLQSLKKGWGDGTALRCTSVGDDNVGKMVTDTDTFSPVGKEAAEPSDDRGVYIIFEDFQFS